LNLGYTVMSKRKLLELVTKNYVNGWDDPRMPTVSGMRRRGYTPESIRKFCKTIGITKFNSMTDPALLDFCIREDLNKVAARRMAVIDPLKVVITNYDENLVEEFDAVNNPEDDSFGTRKVKFTKELFIERSDFMEDAPKKFFRLKVGSEVRFKYAYLVTCNEVIKDEAGNIIQLNCTIDSDSKGGSSPDGRKVKGTIHWVSAKFAKKVETRLYDRLFTVENPDDGEGDYKQNLNPQSLIVSSALVEPALLDAKIGEPIQFERTGYFCIDKDSTQENVIFNRTIGLKDSWAKEANK
ncbi:MAG: glutamate--tRNA ligase family protein, partial [Lentisphaeria bacterium]